MRFDWAVLHQINKNMIFIALENNIYYRDVVGIQSFIDNTAYIFGIMWKVTGKRKWNCKFFLVNIKREQFNLPTFMLLSF